MSGFSPESVAPTLVANASEFIERATEEVESSPRFAVIHFATGIELLLKARLVIEHWVLIFALPERATRDALFRGDFRSVSSGAAMDRLGKILDAPLPKAAREAFESLAERRNRFIHFADPSQLAAGAERERLIEAIVEEQIRAWYELHALLRGDWADDFAPYRTTIERLDRAMHEQRRFLNHKSERIADDLGAVRAGGGTVDECEACGFTAVVEAARYGDLGVGLCRVCGRETRWLHIDRDGPIRVGEEGTPLPPNTGPSVDVVDLAEHYAPWQRPEDHHSDPATAYCGACGFTVAQTVVPWEPGWEYDSWEPNRVVLAPPQWLCVNCLDVPDYSPSRCEWCGERVTGETGDYWSPGCSMCAYHLEHDT